MEGNVRLKVGIVGLGKMGLSHYALFNAHPGVEVAAVCDASSYVMDVLTRYTGVSTYARFPDMLEGAALDAVVIATPSRSHAALIHAALSRDIHVFCEKPLTLSPADTSEVVRLGNQRNLVTQVGYHNRFVATFREVKALLDARAIGTVTHALAEAYGSVVTRPQDATWRSRRSEGGGCLYDYAAHAINLLTWYLGEPHRVAGTALARIFSREVEDQVVGTLYFPANVTGQICANWCDASVRKMTTRVTLWGTHGRVYADRQEIQAYLTGRSEAPPGYHPGWNVKYVTDLADPVWFYLRGEEYSQEIDAFVRRVAHRDLIGVNAFGSAAATDNVIAMMMSDAARREGPAETTDARATSPLRGDGRRRLILRRRTGT